MMNLYDATAQGYMAEWREHLATIAADLLAIEKGGSEINGQQLVIRVFRAVHSVRGAGFLGLAKIRELAQQMEDLLADIRSRKTIPKPDQVRVLLRATRRMHELMQSPETSNRADITEIMAALARLYDDNRPSDEKSWPSDAGQMNQNDRNLRVLLAEDDAASRLLLKTFLSRYGECHIAVNGKEAVDAVRSGLKRGQRYDLICMDIMMPEMDGREAVRQVRALEEAHDILPARGAKIIMTTAVEDLKEVIRCFEEFSDAYLMKPISLASLLSQMRSCQLVG